jgi:hypothetical protein
MFALMSASVEAEESACASTGDRGRDNCPLAFTESGIGQPGNRWRSRAHPGRIWGVWLVPQLLDSARFKACIGAVGHCQIGAPQKSELGDFNILAIKLGRGWGGQLAG